MTLRLAVLSVHTCPLAPLGGWETGGMNVYLREICRELAARDVQVDIFTRRQKDHTADIVQLAPNARIVHVDAGPPRALDKYDVLDHLSEFACGVQRARMLMGSRYDLIHAHYWLSMPLALKFRERWHVPLIAQFHTLSQLKNRVARDDAEREYSERLQLEEDAIVGADRLIALSATDRQQMIDHYGACERKIEIVPGGVDLQRFRPGSRRDARGALGLSTDAAVFLYVGRIQRLKGIDVLLRAAAELRGDSHLSSRLRVLVVGGQPAGAGPRDPEQRELARLKAMAGRLGIDDIVSFVGAVDQDRLPLYYQAADATVMPSSYESFGLVAAESMACGTPVVASRVGGLRTLITDGATGFLIPWRHPRLFAEKLELLAVQPQLHARLGRNGSQAMRWLSWGAAADRLLEVYRQELARVVPSLDVATARRPSLS